MRLRSAGGAEPSQRAVPSKLPQSLQSAQPPQPLQCSQFSQLPQPSQAHQPIQPRQALQARQQQTTQQLRRLRDASRPLLRTLAAVSVLQRWARAHLLGGRVGPKNGVRSVPRSSADISGNARGIADNTSEIADNTSEICEIDENSPAPAPHGQFQHPGRPGWPANSTAAPSDIIMQNRAINRSTASQSSQENPRLRLVKAFVGFYERKYREPVVNASADARNAAFRDFCGRVILARFRRYRARQRYYYARYDIYKTAALAIYSAFLASPASHTDFIKIRKTRRIQKILRALISRRQFTALKTALHTLADSAATDTLALLKALSPVDFALLSSFQTPFTLRFRLGSEKLSWPPKIYWKAFLATPVTDIAATAPRSYALELKTGKTDQRLWYVRITNAQWRPLDGSKDLLSQRSRFVPRPCATREDVYNAKMRRRLQWQRQLRDGFLLEQIGAVFGAGEEEPGAKDSQRIAPPQALKNPKGLKDHGIQPQAPDSVAQMLRWTEQLDYLQYADQWLHFCASTCANRPHGDDSAEGTENDEFQAEMQQIKAQIAGQPGDPAETLRAVDAVLEQHEQQRQKERQRPQSSLAGSFEGSLDGSGDENGDEGNHGFIEDAEASELVLQMQTAAQ